MHNSGKWDTGSTEKLSDINCESCDKKNVLHVCSLVRYICNPKNKN